MNPSPALNPEFMEKLAGILPPDQIHLNEPMADHTTFRVGGPADVYTEAADAGQLMALRSLCADEGVPCMVIGNGSNLLVSDKGYRGVVISLTGEFTSIEVEGNFVRAGAAAKLSAVARKALEASLSGLEFASGIPGSVGGAVRMNAGAYGSEIKDVLVEATVLTLAGEILIIPAEGLELGYRTSCIEKNDYTVLEAFFMLTPGDKKDIQARMDELAEKRRSKQPLEYPSAGSTFKRPTGYFAGKLIEDAGLRGFSVGGAQVSEKHCGFVINHDHATAGDIYRLCREVQRRVYENSGVELEMEVRLLGDF